MANEFQFDNGDEQVSGGKIETFKGEKDRTYRVSFASFPRKDGTLDLTAASPTFQGAKTTYIKDIGHVMTKGTDFEKALGMEFKDRIATVLVIWPTDRKGTIDPARVKAGDFEVKPWVFSGDKFAALRNINREFPSSAHDLLVTCSDAQFQKMTFSPCKNSVLVQVLAHPELAAKLMKGIDHFTAMLQRLVGKDMTLQQIRAKQSGEGGSVVADAVAVATVNIDNVVDNLLD